MSLPRKTFRSTGIGRKKRGRAWIHRVPSADNPARHRTPRVDVTFATPPASKVQAGVELMRGVSVAVH